MTAPVAVDVLAVMAAHAKMREMFLPACGVDMCGVINPDPTNPAHAANIRRHADAVEARAAVADLFAKTDEAATAMRVVALAIENGHENWSKEDCIAFLRLHADALSAGLASAGGTQ